MNKLNIFKPNMKVRIKLESGIFIDGVLSEVMPWVETPCWWVSANINGISDVILASEEDLLIWNFADSYSQEIKCSCGASKVKHPGHAYHCLLVVNKLVGTS